MQPASDATVALARTWIDECVTRHSLCSNTLLSAGGPTRLLQIISGHDGVMSLQLIACSGLGPPPPYAALSYCWGGSQSLVLSYVSQEVWLRGVPATMLPQTIKDAVTVAHSLGIGYLWVDALCILQDDTNDKLNEIGKMASVFEQAYVTISAARSAAIGEGFLQPRHSTERIFRLPFLCKDGAIGSVFLLWGWSALDTEPIDLRGWTYQESALSTRVPEYGNRQLRWRCRLKCHFHHDTPVVDGWSGFKRQIDDTMISDDALSTRPPRSVFQKHLHFSSSGSWKNIIQDYSSRSISDPRDRLLAISAVARKFKGLADDECMAGLWRKDIPRLLLWRSCAEFPPPEYLAPSWSWASLLGPISFHNIEPRDADLELVAVQVQYLVPHDPYGRITGGFLQVRGIVAEAVAWPDLLGALLVSRYTVRLGKPGVFGDDRTHVRIGYLDLRYDDGRLVDDTCKERILLLGISERQTRGLMLRTLPDGKFYRVGTFGPDTSLQNEEKVIGFNWERRLITIV